MVNTLIDEAIVLIAQGAKTLVVRTATDWCELVSQFSGSHPSLAFRLELAQAERLTANFEQAQTWVNA